MQKIKKLAWIFPAAQSLSGFSKAGYLAESLVPLLRENFDLACYEVTSRDSKEELSARIVEGMQSKSFDALIYNIDASEASAVIRRVLGVIPGFVCFHDFFLPSLPQDLLATHPRHSSLQVTWSCWADFIRSEENVPELFPVFEVSHALSIFVTQERDAEECARILRQCKYYPGEDTKAPIFCVGKALGEIEESVGSGVAIFGGTQAEYKVEKTLEAVRQSSYSGPVRWLVSADMVAEAKDILADCGLNQVELVVGDTPQAWDEIVNKSSVAIHLQFSAVRNQDPFMLQSLAAGLCVATSNFGYGEFLPDDVVCKIDLGAYEIEQLVNVLTMSEAEINSCGKRARSFASENFDLRQMAKEISLVLEQKSEHAVAALELWDSLTVHKPKRQA